MHVPVQTEQEAVGRINLLFEALPRFRRKPGRRMMHQEEVRTAGQVVQRRARRAVTERVMKLLGEQLVS